MNAERIWTVKLKPWEEDRLRAGHLWVFSNELETALKDAPAGALAAAVDSNDKPLGLGFYNPHSLIAWRRLTEKDEPVDEAFFLRRLEEALRLRQRFYPGLKSFRLCFGESDGLPGLIVDKYENALCLQVLSAGIDARLGLVVSALKSLLHPKSIYLRNDHPSRVLEGLKEERRVLEGDFPERVTIDEAGLKFIVPVRGGQKTGFYFDQRDNRAIVARYARGRRVLDLHSYVGGFALACARAGAEKVLGLDSSPAVIELARENAALNGLSPKCDFDVGDAEEVLENFSSGGQDFKPDLVVVDPPSFVPSKKHLMKALKAYTRLNAMALKSLGSGGLLATSTCSHHVGREEFLIMLRHSGARSGRRLRLLELGTQAKDHPVLLGMPETQYLHFALLEVL